MPRTDEPEAPLTLPSPLRERGPFCFLSPQGERIKVRGGSDRQEKKTEAVQLKVSEITATGRLTGAAVAPVKLNEEFSGPYRVAVRGRKKTL
jgi:hypothetical protein